MLAAPGKSDNTLLEYAIAGYAFYLTAPGRDAERAQAVTAYCKALNANDNKYNKEFLIRQLQVVGKEDAVPCIEKYINDEFLGGPAARALALIGTPSANKILQSALASSAGANRLSLVEAVGYARYKPAGAALQAALPKATGDERKVTLYALAQIADPASLGVLEAAARVAASIFERLIGSSTRPFQPVKSLPLKSGTKPAPAGISSRRFLIACRW